MSVLFIDVQKVSKSENKTRDGSPVRNPLDKQDKIKGKGFKVQKETIRVDGIRSAREWNLSFDQEAQFHGEDMTIIYFAGDGVRESEPSMTILEGHKEFSKRLKSIQLEGGGS